ncbi:iron complex outermembrane recepter protein [Fodinibius roseus]|uniref:Iron complex outermembrane recepter protein n=1 Tax=Fodinibius roseus TaxID=1194090 RepID=A0A1M5F2D4_9BACT|nr:iron complex outermembrane recepter protein [Fodinibius roseus]
MIKHGILCKRILQHLKLKALKNKKLQLFGSGAYSGISRLCLAAFIICGLGVIQQLHAQETEVRGTVTDAADGLPLPGVNVTVLGTTTGTSTNPDGEYSLTVPSPEDTLVFSFVGYIAREIPVNGRNTINVALKSDVQELEDVVVIGYGTQREGEATGSISSVSQDEFNQGVMTSPEQLLQGRASGVQITPASGEPGAGMNIRIRGTSSVRSGNNPLIVVDGVPLAGGNTTPGGGDFGAGEQSARNPLSFLNPDDIESMSVLKDASASAIYGSRGSNGVILITTKSGQAGETGTFNFSASTSISSVRKKIDLVDPENYVELAEEAGADPSVLDFGSTTDWQDRIYRNALTQEYSLGYGGGNETTNYRLSMGYMDQEGLVESSGLERLTGRLNASHKLLDEKIQLSLNLVASRLNDTYAPVTRNAGFEGDLIGAALQANPTRPVFDENGDYTQSSDFRNPVAMLDYINDKANTTRLLASIGATYNIADWLTYNLDVSFDNSEAVRRTGIEPRLWFPDLGYDPETGRSNGRAVVDNLYNNSTVIEHTLNSEFSLSEEAMLDLLAGFSYQEFEDRGDWLQAEYFVTDEISLVDNVDGVNNDDNKAFTASSFRNVEELQSFFGRTTLNYDDRYLFNASFRMDGSTKFGENNKYGYFPSGSVGWRISEENFYTGSGLSSTLTNLKFRVGYGITGNQEYPGGASLARFEVQSDGSLVQVNNPNPDIQWEETKQLSAGIDFGINEGRINGSVDYFNKQTTNLIFLRNFAQPAAVESQWVNLDGTVLNTGLELSLDAYVIEKPAFSWQLQYNMSYIYNEVKDLGTYVNTGEIHGQGLSGAYAQRIAEDQPLFSFYMREFEGYDENGFAEYANSAALDFQGDPLPDYNLGLTNNFNFGRWSMSMFWSASLGFQVYNNTANAIFLKGNLRNGRNVTSEVAESAESSANFGEVSTRFLEDGDYLRLANLSIGYNFNIPDMAPVNRLRVSLTGQNLLLFTGYTGYDPEVNTDKSIDGVPSLGIDYTSYPRPRTVSLKVQLDI